MRLGRTSRPFIVIGLIAITNVAATVVQGTSPTDITGWVQSGGWGALLALVLFWKRQDDQRYSADLRTINQELMSQNNKMIDTMLSISKSLGEVMVLIRESREASSREHK